MKVANTRESLVLALKNDKNSGRWEEFVNQYYDYLSYAACKVDKETDRLVFVDDRKLEGGWGGTEDAVGAADKRYEGTCESGEDRAYGPAYDEDEASWRASCSARSKSSGFWRAARPPMSGKG